jgi:hypothetical protein
MEKNGPARTDPSTRDWAVVDSTGEWVLWERRDDQDLIWHNFVLRRDRFEPKERSTFWGGWDGQRLASNSDMRALKKRFPELYGWLENACKVAQWAKC